MNGTNTRKGKAFTSGTVSFIVTNAGKMTVKNMAKVLHRTEKSIRRKAERLGIKLKVN